MSVPTDLAIQAKAQPWTEAELELLRREYEAGALEIEIAAMLGRSLHSVRSTRGVRGIRRPRETMRRAPEWTTSEVDIARGLYEQGASRREIALAVNRSEVAIKRMVTTAQWKRGPRDLAPDLSRFCSSDEEWRPISGWRYAVSSRGRVMSLHDGRIGELLAPHADGDGYMHVHLSRGSGGKRHAVHVLVAHAFVGPKPSPRHQVAHGDGTRSNNAASNLRWATPKENQNDRYEHATTNWLVDHAALGRAILRVSAGQTTKAAAAAEAIDQQSLRRVVNKVRRLEALSD